MLGFSYDEIKFYYLVLFDTMLLIVFFYVRVLDGYCECYPASKIALNTNHYSKYTITQLYVRIV